MQQFTIKIMYYMASNNTTWLMNIIMSDLLQSMTLEKLYV